MIYFEKWYARIWKNSEETERNGQSILFWGVQAEASGEVSVRTLKSNRQVIWYDEIHSAGKGQLR